MHRPRKRGRDGEWGMACSDDTPGSKEGKELGTVVDGQLGVSPLKFLP